jgi:putative DNA primase/helicase
LELYKGYTKNEGKKPLDKIKGATSFRTLEEAQQFDSYGGVLADNVILVDIDDPEQSEILMDIVEDLQLNCKVIQTSRGRHFLFVNDGIEKGGTGLQLACGLTADIKLGNKNAVECLKIYGEERFCEWDSDTYDPLPAWLKPVNTDMKLFGLSEGDGRNETLYGYILVLQHAAMLKGDIIRTLEIINQYIFKVPLSESEMQTICRDEAFQKPIFKEGKTFLHDKFALYLKNTNYIKRINGQLHIYKDGTYISGYRELEAAMIRIMPESKDAQRREVLKYLEIICGDDTKQADANLIAFANGVYNLTTRELQEFSPEIVVTNQIPWDYNPDAYAEICDHTLNKIACNDADIRALLEEMIGYCFYRKNELSKAFICTGTKSNGKSTFLEMIQNVLGQGNYSALGLDELDEKFSTFTMAGKLANIGDDISDEFLQGRSVALFKKLVSGNMIKGEIKNNPDIFFFKPTVKLIFSANDIPRMKDKTGAVLRRLIIVPFNATFSKNDEDYDPYIIWKLKDRAVMEYLIKIGIDGLHRVIEQNAFTKSAKVEREIQEYEELNDPMTLFLQEVDASEILNYETKDVHARYQVFCTSLNVMPMGLPQFSREINRRLDCEVRDRRLSGRRCRVFVANCPN